MVIYFSKLNLVSAHVFELYKDVNMLKGILRVLIGDIKSGTSFEDASIYVDDDGKQFTTSVFYRINVQNKTDEFVDGYVYKDSTLYYKTFDEAQGKLIKRSQDYTDAIRFHFDVFKEAIGFHTTGRFGYQEFNKAFTGIINKCMENADREYRFDVALRTEGLEIEEIKDELNRIGNISYLKLKFQPPNPDTDTLEQMQKNGDEFISDMKRANVTGVSFLFDSKGNVGMNLDSDIVKDKIDIIENLNQALGDKKAVSKGYLSVEAQGTNGKRYTTADAKPIKTEINKEEEFMKACCDTIQTLQ